MADEVRVGTAEREAAVAELGTHLEAGRLDPDEYAERATAASVARTQPDLDVLFTDLPRATPTSAAKVSLTKDGLAGSARHPQQLARTEAGHSELAGRIWAASGSIAVLVYMVLGFAFGAWAWGWLIFLVIPIVARISGHDDDRHRKRPRPDR